MRSVRSRLTYANVISTLCMFLLLGGATALAAGRLGKNSVGTKQIKKNAVTAPKIKNNAIGGAKISTGAITGSKVANGSLTGANINLSTLGTVPNATHATDADSTDGMHLGKLDFLLGNNAPPTTVFSGDGLTLTAECKAEQLEFTATTSVNNTEIYESGNYESTFKGSYASGFNVGEVEKVGEGIGDESQDEDQGQLVYSNPAGGIVTAQFSLNDAALAVGTGCSVQGTTESS
jgi:hypothetical protein